MLGEVHFKTVDSHYS